MNSLKIATIAAIMLWQQTYPAPGPGRQATSAPSNCPFTDSFSGSGALSASWSTITASGITSSGKTIVQASGQAEISAPYYLAGAIVTGGACSFPEDQYAQVTVTANSAAGAQLSLFLLMTTAGNGYSFQANEGTANAYLYSLTAGTRTLEKTCASANIAAGSIMKAVVTGSGATQTITGYVNNGSGFVEPSGCSYTNQTYTTGVPGIWLSSEGAASTLQLTAFSAD